MTSTTDAAPGPSTGDATDLPVAFTRVLRGAGLNVPVGAAIAFGEALGLVGTTTRESVYWAGRATLVRRPEDIVVFDRAFAVFWDRRSATFALPEPAEPLRITIAVDDDEGDGGDGTAEADDEPTIQLRFSATEVLRHKDFADCTDDELALAQQMMSALRFAGPPRRSVRTRRDQRGHLPDLRATVRCAIAAGGEPIDRRWRDHDERLRRLVLLLDVSGSMEPYARGMLRFVHAAVAGRQRVEAFALGTRLTRVTRELSSRDPDKALRQAADRVVDWSGGTRLGDCIQRFNDEWGVRGMARGAIVVILSDGWDRGDPDQLGEQMARLHRVTHRLVWVNPLKVTPGYAPLARGMAAALPHVDAFVEGHSVGAMEELAGVIGADTVRADHRPRRVGAEAARS